MRARKRRGTKEAPPDLSEEMGALIAFKTATFTTLGYHRNGVWSEETAAQKEEHFGLLFGALAAARRSSLTGHGIPMQSLTFALLVFPRVWDWYVQWRQRRRGFYTSWEVSMLHQAVALTRSRTGWIRQNCWLADRLKPVDDLVSAEDIARVKADWSGACDELCAYAGDRAKDIARVARVHRDPFEPVMVVLEADSPLAEYRKITDEILKTMPDERRNPLGAAEATRSFLMLRLGLHLGVRQKNLRQLLLCRRGSVPRSERELEALRRGELRWSEKDAGWEVLIPAAAFKNSGSSFFGKKPFRLLLPDLGGLYEHLDRYVCGQRALLMKTADDPGTVFVKTVKTFTRDASYDQCHFYEAWCVTIQRYGVFNPYTGRGAIKGLLPHGPHNVRDVLVTHILKKTGSYEQASYAIQDTPRSVERHYGRFLPHDKTALAAKTLNEVWAD